MKLRAVLATRDAAFLPCFAPPPPKAAEIAHRLVERYSGNWGPRKSASALEALLRRVRRTGYDWDKIVPSDRLDVVWVLWEGTAPPAEHEAFLLGFLQWVATPWRRIQAMRLAAAWAAAFDPNLKSIRVAADWLSRHAARLPDPWPRLTETFAVFSVDRGPAALAESFLASEETARGFFQGLRLPAGAVTGGLALEMLAAAASRVERRLAKEPRLAARLCDLSLQETVFRADMVGRHRNRGRAIRLALAEALLLPWQREAPSPEVKGMVLSFLLRHYGDARVMREHWSDMRAPAAATMRRWLIEETVGTYFRLASETTSADRAQLAERRKFWISCLDQIDDAWLLRGPRGVAGRGADQPAHGRLTGCRPDQIALLLCIGGVTVLEASHVASESVWLPGNPLAPPLYHRADQPYTPAALASGADFSSAFSRKGNDTWQDRLKGFIERQSGRRIAV